MSPSALDALIRPKSIAIIGASADLMKLNGRTLRFLLEKQYAGKIYPVNPKYDEIAGVKAYPDVASLPEAVDLACIALPAHQTEAAVEALAGKGVKAALLFAAGFAELGAEGRALQERIKAKAAAAGLRLCGPNSVGLVNFYDRVLATFSQVGNNEILAGPIGFVTQSGAVGTVVNSIARRRGLGLGYLVNTGNEVDVNFVSAMRAVLEDDRVRLGAGYIEGMADGPGFVALAQNCLETGKPLAVVKVGRSPAGSRAISSHTGALASEDRLFAAIARQFGVQRARNEDHLFDLAEGLAYGRLPEGRGIGMVTQSGGAAVLMADRADELGLNVAELQPETKTRLAEKLPSFAAFGNPVDATAQAIADPSLLGASLEILLDDPGIDIGIVWLQHMESYVDSIVEMFRDLHARMTKPWLVAWAAAPTAALEALRPTGVCVLPGAEPAVDAAHALVSFGERRRIWLAEAGERDRTKLSATAFPEQGGPVPTALACTLLRDAGLPVADALLATSSKEAAEHATTLGGTVALKIESPDILHKSDIGAVKLNLTGGEAARVAYSGVLSAAKRGAPDAEIAGVIVQRMADAGTELVVGLRRDPTFGMMVMAGLGGVFVEVLADVAFRHAPVTKREALEMLQELRGGALLDGARGRPVLDREAIASLISRVSQFGAANADRLVELDLNPVMATTDGLTIVDWLMIINPACET